MLVFVIELVTGNERQKSPSEAIIDSQSVKSAAIVDQQG